MNRCLCTIAVCGVVLGAPLLVRADEPKDADQLLQKYIEAVGGQKKLDAVKTMKIEAKNMMGGGMEMPVSIEMKQPNKIRVEFTMQGMTAIQAFDGSEGWFIMPFMGKTDPEKMSEEQTDQIKDRTNFALPLVDYKAKGYKLELMGKDDLEGTEAYKLKVTKDDDTVEYYYFDAEHLLPLQIKGKREIQGTEMEYTVTLSDYKEVGGLLIAHSVQQQAGGMGGGTMTFEKIEVNAPIDDARFAMPEKEGEPAKQDDTGSKPEEKNEEKGDG